MNRIPFSLTTDASGAGTARSPWPLSGHVHEVGYFGTVLAGTATYTLTRDNGGTVLLYTASANPWRVLPEEQVFTVSGGNVLFGTAAGGTVTAKVPVDGYMTLVVAHGGSVVTDSVDVYVEGEAG